MADLGFIYVLANSAMPGLVKVGKTTRSPTDRAGELSGVTGIPTPFIVVYEQCFQDCSAAESFVHAHLANNGYRISDAREFFNAPANVVIRAIGLAPGAIDGDLEQSDTEMRDVLFVHRAPDELDNLALSFSGSNNPWISIYAEAEAHYYGHDDYIQDYTEALRLYRQAATLGSISAYGRIGQMYEDGEGVSKDASKALSFYKEGARKSSIYCYWKMGNLFSEQANDANAEKCFSLFLRNMPDITPIGQELLSHMPDTHPNGRHLTSYELARIFSGCLSVLLARQYRNTPNQHQVLDTFFAKWAIEISNIAKGGLERSIKLPNLSEMAKHYREVIRYLDVLSPPRGSANRDF